MKFYNLLLNYIFIYQCSAFTRMNVYRERVSPVDSIAIFGSTGLTGKYIVDKSLSEYKQVVSLVRSNHDIKSSDQHKIYKGDVTNYDDVSQIYKNHRIKGTVICLGGNTKSVGISMLTDGTLNIIKAIKENENTSKKIVIITSIGCGSSVDDPPLFFKFLMKTVLKDAFIDKNNQENLFFSGSGRDLEYTIIRPGQLTNGFESNIVIIPKGNGEISRKSVASLCYDAITVTDFPYLKKAISAVSMNDIDPKSKNIEYIPSIDWSQYNLFNKLPP